MSFEEVSGCQAVSSALEGCVLAKDVAGAIAETQGASFAHAPFFDGSFGNQIRFVLSYFYLTSSRRDG